MQLRRTILAGRERNNRKPPSPDASYPAFTLQPFKKLRCRIMLCMPQYLARKGKAEGSVSPCLGKKRGLYLSQLPSCYIS